MEKGKWNILNYKNLYHKSPWFSRFLTVKLSHKNFIFLVHMEHECSLYCVLVLSDLCKICRRNSTLRILELGRKRVFHSLKDLVFSLRKVLYFPFYISSEAWSCAASILSIGLAQKEGGATKYLPWTENPLFSARILFFRSEVADRAVSILSSTEHKQI